MSGAQAVGVQDDFHTLRDAQLVEDAKQVILNGMLGKPQALRNLPIR